MATFVLLVAIDALWIWILLISRIRLDRDVFRWKGERVRPGGASPAVSIVVPARNEEKALPRLLGSLLAQSFPDFEILVVDDQSTDNTAHCVAEHARRDGRVRLLRGRPPPPGWLGKAWAVHQGVTEARGRWVLMTDADTWHAPANLAHAVGFAEEGGLDLLSFASHQECGSFWEKVVQPVVFRLFNLWFDFARVNATDDRAAAAAGPYILMRRQVYEKTGGYEAVRDKVPDDNHLARLVKSAGYRICFLHGFDLLRTHLYQSFAELWAGWAKNLYCVLGGTPAALALALALLLGGGLLPFVVLVMTGALGPASYPGGAMVGSLHVLGTVGLIFSADAWVRARERFPRRYTLALPLGVAIVAAILLRSAYLMRFKRQVVWKGRGYQY